MPLLCGLAPSKINTTIDQYQEPFQEQEDHAALIRQLLRYVQKCYAAQQAGGRAYKK